MTITIEIDQAFLEEVSEEGLFQTAAKVFEHQNIQPEAGLTIQITDDSSLQRLNLEYLGIDAPTDVLSFPVPFEDPETGSYYYGDIVISYPKAAAQAHTGGHTLMDELKLLVIHGMLHLFGFDHASDTEKQEMWSVQNQLLDLLDIQARPAD